MTRGELINMLYPEYHANGTYERIISTAVGATFRLLSDHTNITSIEELSRLTDKQMLRTRFFGPGTLKILRDRLRARGLETPPPLTDHVESWTVKQLDREFVNLGITSVKVNWVRGNRNAPTWIVDAYVTRLSGRVSVYGKTLEAALEQLISDIRKA